MIDWLLPGNLVGRSVNNSTTKRDVVKRLSQLNNKQRLISQTQEMDFKLEGSGGSTLVDTLRK